MPNLLRRLFIKEVSSVDRGAGEGVRVMLMKRDVAAGGMYLAKRSVEADLAEDVENYLKREFTESRRKELASSGAALPDGSYPIENGADLENAIRAIGRAKNPAKAKSHIISRARSLGMTGKLPAGWSSAKKRLIEAVKGLWLPPSLGPDCGPQPNEAVTFDEAQAEEEAAELAEGYLCEIAESCDALNTSVRSILSDEAVKDKPAMIEQTVAQFKEYIQGVVPEWMEKAHAAGTIAAPPVVKGEIMSDAIKKALGLPATATQAEIDAAVTKQASELKKAQREAAIAKMSAEHKAYVEKLDGDARDKFADMSVTERDEHMRKNAPVESESERALRKRLDDQAKENADLKKRLDEKDEAETVTKFEKRAVDLGFTKEFGVTLRKAYSGDAAAQAEVEKQMSALRKQVETGKLFGEVGRSSAQTGTAYAELMAKAEELRKSQPKLTEAQAFTKVYEDRGNAEIVKRYKAEQRSAA